MKFLNKVFNGESADKTPPKELPLHNMLNLKDDLNLIPLDEIAAGELKSADKPHVTPVAETSFPNSASLENEFAYLEKYEKLQNKIDTSELYDIFNTLETISGSISEMNQHKGKPDEFLETWKPLLTNIENFTVKKKLLESIEAQMNQTILEMREIHQKMFDSIGVVRAYNNEREAIYAARRELADDLEKKLRTLENPPL
jgi:hypothetical protein